jgi:pimeloyl-ACP methyl ester carboxylesterase
VPDARVRAAIDHWAPRFVQAGVDYNDFVRTTGAVERWEDWLDAWSETADLHVALAEEAQDAGHPVTAGEAWLRAAVSYHFGRFVWVLDEARSRKAGDRAVAAMATAHDVLGTGLERLEIPLDAGTIVGHLRRPGGEARPPLLVIVPGLDSTKEEFFGLENMALARGMATLSLDGPGQGEGGYTLPIRHDYETAVAAALDALGGREDVDLGRVGALGISMGGYYAPRAAAFEPRIRAVAGISGPYNMGAIWEELPVLTRETFAHKSGAGSDAEGRERASALDLAGVASRIEAPALFITGRLDRLIPWESTRQAAEEAPHGRFVLFEEGNHVCANIPYKARPLAVDWLRDQLG